MVTLWYLFSMIVLTIFFFILCKLFSKYVFFFIIQLLGIFSYYAQYAGYYKLLDVYKESVSKPLLDTLSILPLSIAGFFFASSELIVYLKKNRKKIMFFSYLLIFVLFKYNIFIDIGGYNGIIHIFMSSFFFTGFYLLPLDETNCLIQKFIKQTTSYTNGIYCLQNKTITFITLMFHLKKNFYCGITVINFFCVI